MLKMEGTVPTPHVASLGKYLKLFRMNLKLLLTLRISLTNRIPSDNRCGDPRLIP